jgi:hypothetical protein
MIGCLPSDFLADCQSGCSLYDKNSQLIKIRESIYKNNDFFANNTIL